MALAIALIMCMSISMVAFADDDPPATPTGNTITIKSMADTDEMATNTTTYNWYQFLKADIGSLGTVKQADGTIDGEPGKVAYYVETEALANALDATSVFKATKVNNTRWNIEVEGTPTAEQIAAALNTDAMKALAITSGTATASGANDVAISGLDDGYFLIVASNGNKLVVQTLGDVTINEKNTYPTVNKEVAAEDASAQIGDEVNYTLTVVIPATATKEIVLTDTMTAGLTFKEVKSVKEGTNTLDKTTAGQIYTVSDVDSETNSFTITFPEATVTAYADKTLTIDYVATLNKDAVVGSSANGEDGNDNTVELKYDNKYTSKPVKVETDTQEFKLDKVDGTDTSKKLKGAKFELYKATITGEGDAATATTSGSAIQLIEVTANEVYRVASAEEIADTSVTKVTEITTDGKQITVKGVAGDEEYALVETQAPTSYNQLDKPFPVKVNTTNTLEAQVKNNQGTQLPSTGGIGTTIFYVIGAVLVIGAGVLLVTRRRMRAE